MKLIKVNSSTIDSIGWEDNIMLVVFKKGSSYTYLDVSEEEYESIMSSTSRGSKLKEVVIGKRYKKHE
jgi:hypothetical protein